MTLSFAALGLGLMLMAALQATFGLWPLRRVRTAIADVRAGRQSRIAAALPREIEPLVDEINDLLAFNEGDSRSPRPATGSTSKSG